MLRVTGQVRRPVDVALETLVGRKLMQGAKENAASYAARFFAISNLLPKESPQSLCKYFLMGLKPCLRSACCLNHGQEWEDLSALVQRVYTKEHTLDLTASFSSSLAVVGQDTEGFQPVQPGGKRKQHQQPQLAAAQGPNKKANSGGNPASGYRGYHPTGKGLLPMSECRFWKYEGSIKDKAEIKASLREHWICSYCRGGNPAQPERHPMWACKKKLAHEAKANHSVAATAAEAMQE